MFIEEPPPVSGDSCQVLKIEDQIVAGSTGEHVPHILDYLSIGTGVIKDVNNVYCFQVNGDSMYPEVKDRDLVVARRNCTWEQADDKICAVSVDDVLMLKKVIHDRANKVMILVSINSDFDPIIVLPQSSTVK